MTATNLELNGIDNAQVIEAAVVPNEFRGERVNLHTLKNNQRRHSIAREGRDTQTVEVPAVKIDDIVAEIRPDGIKLSIEGAEIELLQSWEPPPLFTMWSSSGTSKWTAGSTLWHKGLNVFATSTQKGRHGKKSEFHQRHL